MNLRCHYCYHTFETALGLSEHTERCQKLALERDRKKEASLAKGKIPAPLVFKYIKPDSTDLPGWIDRPLTSITLTPNGEWVY